MCGWTQVHITWAGGDELRLETLLRSLIQGFERLGDANQASAARLELAARISPRNRAVSQAELAAIEPDESGPVRACYDIVDGVTRAGAGQHVHAIRSLLRAFHELQDCGMRYRAVGCCTLLAYSFSSLGDPGQAIEWAQRGLSLSEPGWTLRNCTCRLELATALTRQQQTGEARQILETLIAQLQHRPHSRVMHQARCLLGRLDAAEGRWAAATGQFEALLATSRQTGFIDMEADAIEGLAGCAQGAGDQVQARALVQQGLAVVRGQRFTGQERDLMLRAADIELQAGHPALSLKLLERVEALIAANAEPGTPRPWLRLAARAHEQLGHWPQALDCERRAAEAERAELSTAWEQRVRAREALEELQQMRRQNETLRQQSNAAAERAAAAERSLHTLEHLAVIGLGLTARLSQDELFPLVDRELCNLLPVDVVMLFQRRSEKLELLYGRAEGQLLPLDPIALDDPHSLAARCAREDRLLCLEGEQLASRIAGVAATHSLLFAPLRWQGRVVGVLSLQAQAHDAYGPREQQLVLSLAAYMAIALQNAYAYERVTALQHELAERRRQAALGSLVAGVAHELNTPLGNGLLTVGTMQSKVSQLQAQLNSGTPRRSQLLASADDLTAGLHLLEQGLLRAARLVRDFKELATTPESEPVELLDVPTLCDQLLRSEHSTVQRTGLHVTLAMQPHPPLPSRQHALVEVLRSLLDNVVVHAGANRLSVRGGCDAGWYRIDWEDDGQGIEVQPPTRVFDPFFSTRFGQGGSGLGLSVALHRARVLLGGELTVDSRPGEGCRFQLKLPLAGPAEMPLQS